MNDYIIGNHANLDGLGINVLDIGMIFFFPLSFFFGRFAVLHIFSLDAHLTCVAQD